MKDSQMLHRNKQNRFLYMAVAMFVSMRRSVAESYGTFEMVEEYEIPPYEVSSTDNLTGYQLIGFNQLDSAGQILGKGILAFTLLDVVYTNSLLFCEEEDCCEARNYSYDTIPHPEVIWSPYSDLVFPPCDMRELLADLSNNCSIVPSEPALNQTLLPDILKHNISTICSYYTLFNQSGLSNALSQCIQDVFDQRWKSYCYFYDLNIFNGTIDYAAIGAVSLALNVASLTYLFFRRFSNKCSANPGKCAFWFMYTASLVPESYNVFFTAWGLFSLINKILVERDFVESLLSLQVAGTVSVIIMFSFTFLRVCLMVSSRKSFAESHGFSRRGISFLIGSFLSFVRSTLKASSMFVLSMEFFSSELGFVDNPTLAVTNSSFLAALALFGSIRESNMFESFYLSYSGRSKAFCKRDYLSSRYSDLFLVLTAPLTLIICSSFLSTFSTMSISAGDDSSMRALSYIAFVALSYCANLLAKTEESFGLIYELILELLEGWAFMYVTFLKMVDQGQSIDAVMNDYYYSVEPFWVSGLFACVRVFSFILGSSESKFAPSLLKAIKNKNKELMQEFEEKKSEAKRKQIKRVKMPRGKAEEFGGFLVPQGNHKYQLIAQLEEESLTPPVQENFFNFQLEKPMDFLFGTVLGGYYINELYEFWHGCDETDENKGIPEGEINSLDVNLEDTDVSEMGSYDAVTIVPMDSPRELEEDEEESENVQWPTATLIFLVSVIATIPFGMNLNAASNAVQYCLNSLDNMESNNTLTVNCSSECYDYYPGKIDVHDIGSSCFVLMYCISLFVVCFRVSTFPCKQKGSMTPETQRMIAALIFFISSILPLSFSGLALNEWAPDFNVAKALNLSCKSPDAPFSETKKHLSLAGYLCLSMGLFSGVFSGAYLIYKLCARRSSDKSQQEQVRSPRHFCSSNVYSGESRREALIRTLGNEDNSRDGLIPRVRGEGRGLN